MEHLKFRVLEKYAGMRLDKFLKTVFQNRFSRTFMKKLIDGGNVRSDGQIVKPHHGVSAGDTVEIQIPDPEKLELEAENNALDIVYEDNDLIVVNKPSGMSVHPVGGHLRGTLVNALLYHCADLSGIGGVLRPGIVHRLDKDTTGLIVVAKNDRTHASLSEQFKKRAIERKYIALARRIVQLDNGKIDIPVARRKADVTKMGVTFVDAKKKSAVTRYKVLKRFKNFTMLELTLETGRTHQIRVHLSYIGHPLIGDGLYGSKKGLNRHALHAKRLGFFHPTKKEFMRFESPLPKDMLELIERGEV